MENLAHSQFSQDARHQIPLTHRDPTARDDRIAVGSGRAQHPLQLDLVVADHPEVDDVAAGIGQESCQPSGRDKTSLVLSVTHKAGALYAALEPFRDNGLNLTRIESRPSKRNPWEYYFFIDFEGHRQDRDAIKAEMDAVQTHRETVQPIREKTGGSTFKNPPGTSAWKEIDKAGCRGLMIGGAQMSPMHCNFMINTGTATSHDLETLGEVVRARVLENSGIRLEWEIKRVGLFREGQTVQEFMGRML